MPRENWFQIPFEVLSVIHVWPGRVLVLYIFQFHQKANSKLFNGWLFKVQMAGFVRQISSWYSPNDLLCQLIAILSGQRREFPGKYIDVQQNLIGNENAVPVKNILQRRSTVRMQLKIVIGPNINCLQTISIRISSSIKTPVLTAPR